MKLGISWIQQENTLKISAFRNGLWIRFKSIFFVNIIVNKSLFKFLLNPPPHAHKFPPSWWFKVLDITPLFPLLFFSSAPAQPRPITMFCTVKLLNTRSKQIKETPCPSSIHLFIYSSTHLFIYSSIYPSIHLFILLSIHLFVYSFIHLFTYLYILPSSFSSIHRFIPSSFYPFIYSIFHLFIHSSIHPFFFSPIYLFIHSSYSIFL